MNDQVNAAFEGVGAVLSILNVRQLLREKQVRGVYWPVTAFFTAWGCWNLYYYPSLGQWWSFAAGAALCAVNLVWVVLAVDTVVNPPTDPGRAC